MRLTIVKTELRFRLFGRAMSVYIHTLSISIESMEHVIGYIEWKVSFVKRVHHIYQIDEQPT